MNRTDLIDADLLWGLTALTIFVSLVIHGLTACPAMAWLAQQRVPVP